MPDYSKSKIYKLISNHTNEIYIGSTCQSLSMRKAAHSRDYKSYLRGKYHYVSSFKIFEKGDVDIVLIEECNFHNKDELHKRERYYIEKYKCVNKYLPYRTHEEYLEDNKNNAKKWRENNKDKVKQNNKEYHQKKKLEKIKNENHSIET